MIRQGMRFRMLFITILYIFEDCFHSHVAHGNFSNEKRVWFLDSITLWGILQIIIQNKIYISAIFSNCTTTLGKICYRVIFGYVARLVFFDNRMKT